MFKRCFGLLALFVLLSTGVVSAQDGGSTLAAWADTPASAFDVSRQIEWPTYQLTFNQANTYSGNGDPATSCMSSSSFSLWHTFVPTQTGRLQIDAAGSNYDVFLAIYRTSVTAANEIKCVDASPSIGFLDGTSLNVVAGTRYYVMIAAANLTGIDATSTITVRYSSNSILDRSFVIPASGVYSNTQDRIELASAASYATPGGCPDRSYNVYYKFRPTVSGRYEITTQGSNYDTVLALYEASAIVAGSSLSGAITNCHDDISSENVTSRLRVNLVARTTYWFIVGQSAESSAPMTDNMNLSLRVRKL